MKSIWLPSTPPAALISLTASLAPFAAGRSSADSSPVRANPPPILMGPPVPPLEPDPVLAPVVGAAPLEPAPVVAAGVLLQAAASPRTVASANPRAMVLRIVVSSGPPRAVPRANGRSVPQRVGWEQSGIVARR